MRRKYITADSMEYLVNDFDILETVNNKRVFPKGGGFYKLLGYLPTGAKTYNDITPTYKEGHRLLLVDEAEEFLSFEFISFGICRFREHPTQKHISKPIMEKIDLV